MKAEVASRLIIRCFEINHTIGLITLHATSYQYLPMQLLFSWYSKPLLHPRHFSLCTILISISSNLIIAAANIIPLSQSGLFQSSTRTHPFYPYLCVHKNYFFLIPSVDIITEFCTCTSTCTPISSCSCWENSRQKYDSVDGPLPY